MKGYWKLWTGIGFFLLAGILMCWGATNVAALPDGTGVGALPLPTGFSGWEMMIPLLVPVVLAGVKGYWTNVPPWVLPWAAPVVGLLADYLLNLSGLTAQANPMLGLFLGKAGTGLREIVDQTKQRAMQVPAAGLLVGLLALGVSGCASNPAPPTAMEQRFFAIETNHINQIVSVTNTIPVFQTNVVVATVTVTNAALELVQRVVTNTVVEKLYETNQVTVTNVPVETYHMTPNANAAKVGSVAGTIAAPWGMAGLATLGVTALYGLWAGVSNRQWAAKVQGLTQSQQAASQIGGVLTQNIETMLAVMEQTPQGQALVPRVKNYLASHQAEVGVVGGVAELLKQVDEPGAREVADEILKALPAIGNIPTPTKV
jgi:hypothetical protein